MKVRNNKGETAYDIAVKNGQDSIVNKLSSFMGQSALDKLAKPRSPHDQDDDV